MSGKKSYTKLKKKFKLLYLTSAQATICKEESWHILHFFFRWELKSTPSNTQWLTNYKKGLFLNTKGLGLDVKLISSSNVNSFLFNFYVFLV